LSISRFFTDKNISFLFLSSSRPASSDFIWFCLVHIYCKNNFAVTLISADISWYHTTSTDVSWYQLISADIIRPQLTSADISWYQLTSDFFPNLIFFYKIFYFFFSKTVFLHKIYQKNMKTCSIGIAPSINT
jgi:hypothetical protein